MCPVLGCKTWDPPHLEDQQSQAAAKLSTFRLQDAARISGSNGRKVRESMCPVLGNSSGDMDYR